MAFGPSGGIAFVKFNGMQYQLRGELTVQPNMTELDWMANQDGTIVYTEKAVVPYMEMKISDSGGLSVQQISAMRGVTIQAEQNNGKTYMLQQGSPWGEIKTDTVKGEISVKFAGLACYERLGS